MILANLINFMETCMFMLIISIKINYRTLKKGYFDTRYYDTATEVVECFISQTNMIEDICIIIYLLFKYNEYKIKDGFSIKSVVNAYNDDLITKFENNKIKLTACNLLYHALAYYEDETVVLKYKKIYPNEDYENLEDARDNKQPDDDY